MDQILALRPFVPAREFAVSRAFYEALGFRATHTDEQVCILKQGSFSFILQNFYKSELAENLMVQVLVRDADAWFGDHVEADKLVETFGVKPPIAPAMQPWGLKVGFVFDPCGVLLHIAEAPF